MLVDATGRERRLVDALAGAGLPMASACPPPPGGARPQLSWFERPAGLPADAPQHQVDPGATLAALGRAVRLLHETPPPPADPTPAATAGVPALDAGALVARAAAEVAGGAVTGAHLADARAHLHPARVVEQLQALLPVLDARHARRPVRPGLTHGGARRAAIWLDGGRLSALVDVADAAVADPYRDLAAMTRDLAGALGPEALAPFLDAYGEPSPDVVRLEFHALLDELR
ncbi:MAG: phosphotransferase [Acidimicrobiia bacterium]